MLSQSISTGPKIRNTVLKIQCDRHNFNLIHRARAKKKKQNKTTPTLFHAYMMITRQRVCLYTHRIRPVLCPNLKSDQSGK